MKEDGIDTTNKITKEKAKKMMDRIMKDIIDIESTWFVGSTTLFNRRQRIVKKKIQVLRYLDRTERKKFDEDTYLECKNRNSRSQSKSKDKSSKDAKKDKIDDNSGDTKKEINKSKNESEGESDDGDSALIKMISKLVLK